MYVQIRVHKCTSAPSFPPLPIRFSTQIPPSPYTHLGEDLCKRPIPKRPVAQNPPLTLKLFFGEFGQSGNQEKARKPLFLNVKKIDNMYVRPRPPRSPARQPGGRNLCLSRFQASDRYNQHSIFPPVCKWRNAA